MQESAAASPLFERHLEIEPAISKQKSIHCRQIVGILSEPIKTTPTKPFQPIRVNGQNTCLQQVLRTTGRMLFHSLFRVFHEVRGFVGFTDVNLLVFQALTYLKQE